MSKLLSLAFGLALVACRERTPVRSDSASQAPAPAKSDTVRVSEFAFGGLRFGMTVVEAAKVIPGFHAPGEAESCDYVHVPSLEPSSLMVENGIIARVDVKSAFIATAEGARVGDTIPRILALYKGRVTTKPNRYTDQPDLTAHSSVPGDTLHEIVFKTENGRVVQYRAGQRPQVRYIEGCS